MNLSPRLAILSLLRSFPNKRQLSSVENLNCFIVNFPGLSTSRSTVVYDIASNGSRRIPGPIVLAKTMRRTYVPLVAAGRARLIDSMTV